MHEHIAETLRKAIMKRSYLEKEYSKKKNSRFPDTLIKFKKRKNYCNIPYKKERRKYFESLNPSRISGNKRFWKNIQHFFFEKRKVSNKVTLVDNKVKTLTTICFQVNLTNFSKVQQKLTNK